MLLFMLQLLYIFNNIFMLLFMLQLYIILLQDSSIFIFMANFLHFSVSVVTNWSSHGKLLMIGDVYFHSFLVSEHSEEGLIFYAVISQYYTMFLQHIRIIVTDGRHEPAGPQLSDSAALLLCYTIHLLRLNRTKCSSI